MKKSFVLLVSLFSLSVNAQREIKPTDSFKISGVVAAEVTFTLAALDTFKLDSIPDLEIKNNEGVVKKTATNMKGVLLTDLLKNVVYIYEKPRELNEFYFILVASDGYRVVYSWNELYNSEIGKQVYVVVEKDGFKISDMQDRILVLNSSDTNSGRRYVKGVSEIIVARIK